MTSSTGKKKAPHSKVKQPSYKAMHVSSNAKRAAEDAFDSDAVNNADDDDDHDVVNEVVVRNPSQTSKASTNIRPRPRPRPVKAIPKSDEILELTSEEGDDIEGSDKDTLHSGSDDNESEPDAVVEDTKAKAVRTRSSNGISKKRYFKDAAIFSDDEEEFPISITPKKSRLAGTILEFQSRDNNYNKLSDNGFVGNDESLSLSPLKLGQLDQRAQDTNGNLDPFLVKPMLKSGLILNSSKAVGKNKAIAPSIEEVPVSDDGELHPDEIMNITQAIAESAREQRMHAQNKKGSSSKTSGPFVRVKADRVDVNRTASLLDGSDFAPAVVDRSPVVLTRRTFKDVLPQPKTTPIMTNSPLYQEDLMKFRIQALPAVCQVTDSALQDAFLASDYSLLPPLNTGTLNSWSSSHNGMAQVAFSHWAAQCPDMSFDAALAAVRFVRYKNFINPSRISPLDVNIFYTTHDRKRSLLQCNMKTAICLSPILSRDSYLVTATSFGLRNKYISGYFHSQEWQRFEAFVTMVFDKPVMTAQLYNDALSFVTMGPGKESEHSMTDRDGYSPSKAPRHAAILSSKRRTAGVPQHSKYIIANTSFKSILDHTDDVPVYDAREIPFDFAADLEDISAVLPKYTEEIPTHSFVVVAYSLAHYMKDGNANLSTNILFAILIGTE